MDEDKFGQDKDLIEDSLELCADIKRYYEAEEMDRLDFNGYINRKNKPDKNISDKTEIVVINQTDEESGLKLYTKIVAIILFAMVFARIINAYIVQETIVNGSSMNPTLESSDKVLIDKIIYKIDKLNRYDIVVFDYHHSSVYVKRIIGLPGERITIRKGRVYVNGKILKDDPRIKDTMHYAGIARDGVELGKDEYFVLGDNRNNSYDSRYEEVGVVNKSSMIGKVWIRIFPILKFGAVN
ncbi:MAG: signal peptidase I [Catonella sp.]